MFSRSVASEKMSNRSRNDQVAASRRLLCAGAPPKRWSRLKPISKKNQLRFSVLGSAKCENITSFFIPVVKVLFFEIGLRRDHFFGGAPAQSSRREAPTWSFIDRLDIFSDATDLENTLVVLFLRHLPPQRHTRKKRFFL